MFSSFRNRFGIPGVISVVALVFALVGGAFAANNLGGPGKEATVSAKKSLKGPRGPRGAKGATGAEGPAGSQGPTGAAGKNGANGVDGSDGTHGVDGQSITVAEEPAFGECGDEAGIKVSSADGDFYVCNGTEGTDGIIGKDGKEGSPWTAGGTLPTGATLTGTWGFSANLAGTPEVLKHIEAVPISFNIPLSGPINSPDRAVFVEDSNTPHCSAAPINGSLGNPKAESGYLCIYPSPLIGAITPSEVLGPVFAPDNSIVGAAGTTLFFDVTEDTIAYGSWAVTK